MPLPWTLIPGACLSRCSKVISHCAKLFESVTYTSCMQIDLLRAERNSAAGQPQTTTIILSEIILLIAVTSYLSVCNKQHVSTVKEKNSHLLFCSVSAASAISLLMSLVFFFVLSNFSLSTQSSMLIDWLIDFYSVSVNQTMQVWLIMCYVHLCVSYANYAEHTSLLTHLQTILKM